MIARLAAASTTSYILFLLPYLLSALMDYTYDPLISYLTVIAASMASAIISGLLIPGLGSMIPPASGSLASILTNYLSERLLNLSSQIYFEWIYLGLGFIASPIIALLVSRLKLGRAAEVPAAEEVIVEEEAGFIACPACGEQIPSDSIYCPICGSRVAEEA